MEETTKFDISKAAQIVSNTIETMVTDRNQQIALMDAIAAILFANDSESASIIIYSRRQR